METLNSVFQLHDKINTYFRFLPSTYAKAIAELQNQITLLSLDCHLLSFTGFCVCSPFPFCDGFVSFGLFGLDGVCGISGTIGFSGFSGSTSYSALPVSPASLVLPVYSVLPVSPASLALSVYSVLSGFFQVSLALSVFLLFQTVLSVLYSYLP